MKQLRRLLAVWMTSFAMLILMSFVSGCATTSEPPKIVRHPLCQIISWHEDDTPTTLRQIFAHNLKVEDPAICPRSVALN